jgi:hypothetical protein
LVQLTLLAALRPAKLRSRIISLSNSATPARIASMSLLDGTVSIYPMPHFACTSRVLGPSRGRRSANQELMDLVIPRVRADFTLHDSLAAAPSFWIARSWHAAGTYEETRHCRGGNGQDTDVSSALNRIERCESP